MPGQRSLPAAPTSAPRKTPRTATYSKGWSDPGLSRAAAAVPQATAHRRDAAPAPLHGHRRHRGKAREDGGSSGTAPGLRAVLTAREPQHLFPPSRQQQVPSALRDQLLPGGAGCGGEKAEGLRYLPECHSHVRAPSLQLQDLLVGAGSTAGSSSLARSILTLQRRGCGESTAVIPSRPAPSPCHRAQWRRGGGDTVRPFPLPPCLPAE